ncbi:unnamed protein product [Clavelina lepadiformis]|uniref:Uncharacterized protein n=1 Tax=Clavelina lepadiformis TaxID=159417 RepID=A0ABP0FU35_CLALP
MKLGSGEEKQNLPRSDDTASSSNLLPTDDKEKRKCRRKVTKHQAQSSSPACLYFVFFLLTVACFAALFISALFASKVMEIERKEHAMTTQCSVYRDEAQEQRQSIEKLVSKVNILSQRLSSLENEADSKHPEEVLKRMKRSSSGCGCPPGPKGMFYNFIHYVQHLTR